MNSLISIYFNWAIVRVTKIIVILLYFCPKNNTNICYHKNGIEKPYLSPNLWIIPDENNAPSKAPHHDKLSYFSTRFEFMYLDMKLIRDVQMNLSFRLRTVDLAREVVYFELLKIVDRWFGTAGGSKKSSMFRTAWRKRKRQHWEPHSLLLARDVWS